VANADRAVVGRR